MALHRHKMLRGGSACRSVAGLAGGGGPPLVGGVLFGIQVSGTYWSLRYWLLGGVEQHRQL